MLRSLLTGSSYWRSFSYASQIWLCTNTCSFYSSYINKISSPSTSCALCYAYCITTQIGALFNGAIITTSAKCQVICTRTMRTNQCTCVLFVQHGQLHYAQKSLVKENVNRTHAVMNHISSAVTLFISFPLNSCGNHRGT